MRRPSRALDPPLQRFAAPASKLAIGGAWFFIVYSFLCLLWATMMQADATPTSTLSLYMTTVAGESHSAWGLAYTGMPGLVLVVAQLLALPMATVMSAIAHGRLRRIGHVALIAWAGLWLGNLLWLWSLDGELNSIIQASVMALLFGCTIWRAAIGWTKRPDQNDGNQPLGREHVVAAGRVREITSDVCERSGADQGRFAAAPWCTWRAMKVRGRLAPSLQPSGMIGPRHVSRDRC